MNKLKINAMKLTIHDKRKIHEIQKEFSEMFPALRVDFFENPREVARGIPKHLLIHPTKTIGECRTVHKKGHLDILPHMTVAELKRGFGNTFGLSVEVYRKVGDDWLETATEHWTLEKQNANITEMNAEHLLEVL